MRRSYSQGRTRNELPKGKPTCGPSLTCDLNLFFALNTILLFLLLDDVWKTCCTSKKAALDFSKAKKSFGLVIGKASSHNQFSVLMENVYRQECNFCRTMYCRMFLNMCCRKLDLIFKSGSWKSNSMIYYYSSI